MTDQPIVEQPENPKPATDTGAGTQPGKPAGEELKFSQSDLNNIVRDRLKEAKASIIAEVLKDLGVGSLDDAKKATTKLKEIEDAQLTAQQKLERDLQGKTEALTTVESKYQRVLIENAALKAFGGKVAPDRHAAAIKLLDTSKLSVDKDGNVQGIAEAVTALLEENPFLKPSEPAPATPQGKTKNPPIDPTNPAGTSTTPDLSWHPLKRNTEVRIGGGGIINHKKE